MKKIKKSTIKKKPVPAVRKSPALDWDALEFSLIPTDKMWLAAGTKEGLWKLGKLVPFGNLSMSPGAAVLNYGQGLFEGMKALRTAKGKIVLFRPVDNARRLADGCRRLVMPPYPEKEFLEAVKKVVKANQRFIPPAGKGSLYIRPILFGSGGVLGVQAAPTYTLCIFACPVGPYFKTGFKPIKLLITTDYHRAAPKGVGGIKTIGNYAPTILPNVGAKAQGYNEVIYLDGKETKYIEEVGAGNLFIIINGAMVTPPLTGTILPGVTRSSVLTLAREQLRLPVEERPISAAEALTAQEAFCTGTAAVISSIGSITMGGQEHVYNNFEVGPVSRELYRLLTGIQQQELPDPYGWLVEV